VAGEIRTVREAQIPPNAGHVVERGTCNEIVIVADPVRETGKCPEDLRPRGKNSNGVK